MILEPDTRRAEKLRPQGWLVARGRFENRIRCLLDQFPTLQLPIDQLLMSRRCLLASRNALDEEAECLASTDEQCELLPTMPGVDTLTALAFVSAMDWTERFPKAPSVGAYLGLTRRGHQSGKVSWSGRLSKTSDGIAHAMLYEAAKTNKNAEGIHTQLDNTTYGPHAPPH
ncbi:MAG: transposase [Mariprofundaceae bacterium]